MTRSAFEPVSGRCACGAVAYRITGAATALYHCHCSVCRRLHGALFATYACVERERLKVEAGAECLSTYEGELATWRFCRVCGGHLFAEHEHNPGMAWYMPGTLDSGLVPGHPRESEKHIFVSSKSPLARVPDEVAQFEGPVPEDPGAA